jgi:hypothetical protein
MSQFLISQRGVESSHVKLLLNSKATVKNIFTGLQWLAAQGPDVAYFVYSGHGTRVRDLDGDEARQNSGTKYDQAIVPYDYATRGLILDDELAQMYALFPPQTKIIVHFDSCFSAKSDRGLFEDAVDKYIRGREPRALPGKKIPKTAIAATYRNHNKAALFNRYIILLSGCRDFETAADAYLGNGYRGAMTFYIERAIARLGTHASYRSVIEEARRQLAANGFPQIPQLDGPDVWLDRPIYT